jgi:hypothetical protein
MQSAFAIMQQYLPPQPVPGIPLEELKSRFLLNTVLIKSVKDALLSLPQKTALSSRDVLAGYLFAYYRFTDDQDMVGVAIELIDALHTAPTNPEMFMEALQKYEALYFPWKRKDSEQVLKSLTEMYWEFELAFALNTGHMNETEREVYMVDKNNKQQAILQRMMTMDGCRYFCSYVPVIFDGSAVGKIHETLKQAFWDAVEEDLSQTPPKLDAFLRVCSDLRDTVFSIVVSKRCIIERFDDIIDIEYMRLMAERGQAGVDFWWARCDYLIELLCDLDSPVKSAEHQRWYQLVKQKQDGSLSVWRHMLHVLWYVIDHMSVLDEWVNEIRSNLSS